MTNEGLVNVCRSHAPTVQSGERKLRINAKPLVQEETGAQYERQEVFNPCGGATLQFSKCPKAYFGVLMNSFGVAIGNAIITPKQSLDHST